MRRRRASPAVRPQAAAARRAGRTCREAGEAGRAAGGAKPSRRGAPGRGRTRRGRPRGARQAAYFLLCPLLCPSALRPTFVPPKAPGETLALGPRLRRRVAPSSGSGFGGPPRGRAPSSADSGAWVSEGDAGASAPARRLGHADAPCPHPGSLLLSGAGRALGRDPQLER